MKKSKATSRARLKNQRNKNIKIIALIFIIAIALIIYSSVAADKESEKQSFQNDDETRLASILSSVEGAGEVETMITKSSGQIVGVLVIADGANNPIVRLRLLSATASALGVDSDTVSVMSRKTEPIGGIYENETQNKKIIVLSVMVALLVATGVLNFVLSDKLNKTSTDVAGQQDTVTQTFFAAARSDRDATRESEFCILTQS